MSVSVCWGARGGDAKTQVLTNERTRFPYTYIAAAASEEKAWHAQRMASDVLMPRAAMKPFAKNVAP